MLRVPNFRALTIVAALAGAIAFLGVGLPGAPCGRAEIALESDIDSAHILAGEPFAFRTVEAATAPDGTEIPTNSLGHGVIAIAQHAQRGGRGGYIVLEPRYVVVASGAHVPVTVDWAGASRATATGSSQNIPGFAGAVPFAGFILGPYGFLHHGKDITLPRGTKLPVIVGDDEASGMCRVVPITSPSPGSSASPSPLPSASTVPVPTTSPSPAPRPSASPR